MHYQRFKALWTSVLLMLLVGSPVSCEAEPPCPCDRDARNCEDFSSEASAQNCFEHCFDEAGDIHRLDADGDGLACEGLD
jgi:hypothetical protein